MVTKGGTELFIHQVQLLLESNSSWIALKTDVKNVFNSIDRAHLLCQVSRSFPDIYQHVQQMYAGFGSLIFVQDSTSPTIINSEEGVHQEDPLGPVLFATAIQPILSKLQGDWPEVCFLAYLDDVFLLGCPNKVLLAFDSLKSAFSEIGRVTDS